VEITARSRTAKTAMLVVEDMVSPLVAGVTTKETAPS